MTQIKNEQGFEITAEITTQLSDREIHELQRLYKAAKLQYERGDDMGYYTKEAARQTLHILTALFPGQYFKDVDAELNPCPYRIKEGNSYVCKLALAQAKGANYDVICRNISWECKDPLKLQKEQNNAHK